MESEPQRARERAPKTRAKVVIKGARFVSSWKWDIPDEDVCGICLGAFEACCPECKVPGDSCPPMWGQCNHAFHMHCIVKWLTAQQDKGEQQCPLCRREWEIRAT